MRWLVVFGSILFAIVALVAESPKFLDSNEVGKQRDPLAVQLPPPEEKPPEPEENKVELTDPLANLAPESFQTDPQLMNSGFGQGFGAGGPALGSAMGLGGNLQQMVRDDAAVDRSARVTFRGQLNYPADAKRRGMSGEVVLKLYVDSKGVLGDVKVDHANPQGVFENAALEAVRGWRFDPAFVKGQAVASWMMQKIRFELN